jgi:hypothetical protein
MQQVLIVIHPLVVIALVTVILLLSLVTRKIKLKQTMNPVHLLARVTVEAKVNQVT